MAKPELVVAVIGHWSHGKTSVCAALCGLSGPALDPEDLARMAPLNRANLIAACMRRYGISPDHPTVYAAGPIRVETQQNVIYLEDAPGLRDFVKNAARAISLADGALCVVDAVEGVCPQTREHLAIARALGLRQCVLFINGCERVTDLELLDAAEALAREALEETGWYGDDVTVVRGSAKGALDARTHWQDAIGRLGRALDQMQPEPPAEEPLRIDIAHQHVRAGGRVFQGRVRGDEVGQDFRLERVGFGERREVRAFEVQVDRQRVATAKPGQLVGVRIGNEPTIGPSNGCALGRPGELRVTSEIVARVNLFDIARHTVIHSGYQPQVLFGAAAVRGRFDLGGKVRIAPGEEAEVRIVLQHPVPLPDRFCFRDGTERPATTKDRRIATWGGTAGSGVVVSHELA